ncbi:uncharacterized protein LOC112084049 [Eutrema salsugineum]|uniref:uncharacterized protein LOC112084049 n=1 Tax=Eutrema salsugineum TaxID=72664 RepID=UPI000CED583B|nr:uncharacterized protein LOC112084049 [Eutrema salsugineum]
MTDPQKDIYLWILWYIWKARNDKIFNGIEISPLDTLVHAKIEAESWRNANKSEAEEDAFDETNPNSLLPISPPDTLRFPICQVDASWIANGLVSGLGWSLKKERSGEIYGLQGCRRSISALHAELENLLWAMSCVRNKQILSVHFQTDCLDLVNMAESSSDWSSFLSELKIFRSLRESFLDFTISHIPRSSNVRADSLAKGARAKGIIFSQIIYNEPVAGSLLDRFLNESIVM